MVCHVRQLGDLCPPSIAQIKELLHSKPPEIPELGLKLQQLHLLLDREVRAIHSPSSNALDGSKPHVRGTCVSHGGLNALKACLATVPRQVSTQYDSQPQVWMCGHYIWK